MKYLILTAIFLGMQSNAFAGPDSTQSKCLDSSFSSRPIKIKKQNSTLRDSISVVQTQNQSVSIECCEKYAKIEKSNEHETNLIDIINILVSVLDKIVWPLFIFIIIWPLRGSIRKRLESIKRAKYGDLELEFRNELEDTVVTAPNLFDVSTIGLDLSKNILEKTIEIVKVSPRAAIMEAWAELEQVIRKIGQTYEISSVNIVELLKELNLKQFINADERGAINNLRQLRNKATHTYLDDLSKETATEYCLVAIKLSESLKYRAIHWNKN
jgi:Domain of unknown function (DUF4145)